MQIVNVAKAGRGGGLNFVRPGTISSNAGPKCSDLLASVFTLSHFTIFLLGKCLIMKKITCTPQSGVAVTVEKEEY
jgi:hypothetical protein